MMRTILYTRARIVSSRLTHRSLKMMHTNIYSNLAYEIHSPQHRFPMAKYRVVRELLKDEYAGHKNISFVDSPPVTKNELILTHSPSYVERYLSGQLTDMEIKKIGFPWSIAHVTRTLAIVGGTVAATRSVLEHPDRSDVACNIAGGTHHAFYDRGEGFCIFSDIAVAANIALTEYSELVRRVLIVDLDVHQGRLIH